MRLLGAVAGVLAATGVLTLARLAAGPGGDPVARAIGVDPEPGALSAVDRWIDRLEHRLGRADRAGQLDVAGIAEPAFRRLRLCYCCASLVLALALLTLTGPSMVKLMVIVAAIPAGVVATDLHVRRRVDRTRAAVRAQVPMASEVVALAVTAGEGPADALARAASVSGPPVAALLDEIGAEVSAGQPLDGVLLAAAQRLDVPEFHRLADTIVASSSRGLPLAQTLLDQVQDMRTSHHAQLLERAGRREIAMLVPVVFVILPCVVLVAVFPGAVQILSMNG